MIASSPNKSQAHHTRMVPITHLALALPCLAPLALANGYYVDFSRMSVSHLSPMLRYEPAGAWSHNLSASWTDTPGASVTFHHFGRQLEIHGEPPESGTINSASPPFEEVDETWYSPRLNGTAYNSTSGEQIPYNRYRGVMGYNSRLAWRNFTMAVPDNASDVSEAERRIDITHMNWYSPLPIDAEWYRSSSGSGYRP